MLENKETIFIVASGPSARKVNLAALPSFGYVIGVNDVIKHQPNFHAFFTIPQHAYYRSGLSRYGGLTRLDRVNWPRLSERKGIIYAGVNGGTHSGYGALGLAYQHRPKRIYLIGFDMIPQKDSHWSRESNRRWTSEFCALCAKCYDTAKDQLRDAGVDVIVVNPMSAIRAFPRISAEEFHRCL